ncbi:MAG: Holliday junction resolvase Hjc [archaeon]
MAHYNKGASAERELIKLLWNLGFVAARVAGSGKNALPMPDLIALGKGKSFIFECKAWRGNYLNISAEQMAELQKWGEVSGAQAFIGWKYPNKGWFFVKPEHFRKSKHYNISIATTMKVGIPLEVVVGEQRQLKV